MPILADVRHERFAQEIVKGKTQGEAYIAAGYSAKSLAVASAGATRLLKDAKIGARIQELREKAAEKATLDRAWVLQRLMRNAQIAMGDEFLKLKIKKIDKETGEPVVVEMEVSDRDGSVANKSLELLGKVPEISLFVERIEYGGPGDFDNMTDDELRAFIAGRTYSARDSEEEADTSRRGRRAKPKSGGVH